mgnify:CR=1 FL=1
MFLLIYQSSYRTICLIMSHTSNLHHLSSMYAPSATLILAMSFTHSLRLVQTFHLYYLFNIPPRSSISSPPSLPSFSFFTYSVPFASFTTMIVLSFVFILLLHVIVTCSSFVSEYIYQDTSSIISMHFVHECCQS